MLIVVYWIEIQNAGFFFLLWWFGFCFFKVKLIFLLLLQHHLYLNVRKTWINLKWIVFSQALHWLPVKGAPTLLSSSPSVTSHRSQLRVTTLNWMNFLLSPEFISRSVAQLSFVFKHDFALDKTGREPVFWYVAQVTLCMCRHSLMQWAYFMPHEIDVYKLYIISSYAFPPIFFNDVKAQKKKC